MRQLPGSGAVTALGRVAQQPGQHQSHIVLAAVVVVGIAADGRQQQQRVRACGGAGGCYVAGAAGAVLKLHLHLGWRLWGVDVGRRWREAGREGCQSVGGSLNQQLLGMSTTPRQTAGPPMLQQHTIQRPRDAHLCHS